MKVTRRGVMGTMLAAAAAPAMLPDKASAQAPAQASPDADLREARQEITIFARQLASVKLPMSTEPAFRFRA